MFEAYSFKLEKSVTATTVTDTSEVFGCLNPSCTGKFKLKSINGKKAVHFARLTSTPHILNCPYEMDDSEYRNSGLVIKSSLADIFNKTDIAKPISVTDTAERLIEDCALNTKKVYVRTPKQLLKFCISNGLDTKYENDLTVDDIVLDQRNIHIDGNISL